MALAGKILVAISGIAWSVAYIAMIRIGVKDKTYGMPFVALALNIAWELLYAVLGLKYGPGHILTWVNWVWFFFDLAIVYTYFKYGRADFEKHADGKAFIPWAVLVFVMAVALQIGFLIEFSPSPALPSVRSLANPFLGAWYSAFLQNLVMSILFIQMLLTRRGPRGQSLTIAIFKWIGTLAPTVLFGILLESRLVLIVGSLCTVFDLIYIGLLVQTHRHR